MSRKRRNEKVQLPAGVRRQADAAERLQQAAFRYPEHSLKGEPDRQQAWVSADVTIASELAKPNSSKTKAMDAATRQLNRTANMYGYRKPGFRNIKQRASTLPEIPLPTDEMSRTFVWSSGDLQPLRDLHAVAKWTALANGTKRGNRRNQHTIGRWVQALRKAKQAGIPINPSGTLTPDQLALPEVIDAVYSGLLERQRRGKPTIDPWRIAITRQSAHRRALTNSQRHQIKQAQEVVDAADKKTV